FENGGFASLAGTVFRIAYDHTGNLPLGNPFSTSLDGTNYWVTGRIGHNVTPQFYVFAESSGIFQRFNNSPFAPNDTELSGGLGPPIQRVCSEAKFSADIRLSTK